MIIVVKTIITIGQTVAYAAAELWGGFGGAPDGMTEVSPFGSYGAPICRQKPLMIRTSSSVLGIVPRSAERGIFDTRAGEWDTAVLLDFNDEDTTHWIAGIQSGQRNDLQRRQTTNLTMHAATFVIGSLRLKCSRAIITSTATD